MGNRIEGRYWHQIPRASPRVGDPVLSQSKRFGFPAPIIYINSFLVKSLKTFLIPLIFFLFLQPCFALTDEEIQKVQPFLKDRPIGEKIAFWAEKFVGTPYDPDPLGEYVSKAALCGRRAGGLYVSDLQSSGAGPEPQPWGGHPNCPGEKIPFKRGSQGGSGHQLW